MQLIQKLRAMSIHWNDRFFDLGTNLVFLAIPTLLVAVLRCIGPTVGFGPNTFQWEIMSIACMTIVLMATREFFCSYVVPAWLLRSAKEWAARVSKEVRLNLIVKARFGKIIISIAEIGELTRVAHRDWPAFTSGVWSGAFFEKVRNRPTKE